MRTFVYHGPTTIFFLAAGLEFLWPWCCFCSRGLTDNIAEQLKNSPETASLWGQRSAPLSPRPTCPGTGALPSWPPVPLLAESRLNPPKDQERGRGGSWPFHTQRRPSGMYFLKVSLIIEWFSQTWYSDHLWMISHCICNARLYAGKWCWNMMKSQDLAACGP